MEEPMGFRRRKKPEELSEVVGVGYFEGTAEVIPYFWMRWTSRAVHKVRRVFGLKEP
jgi:hypothetical protein